MHRRNDKRCKVAEYNEKHLRFAESEIERQTRLNKQKEYDHEKRSAESEIDKQMRQTKDKTSGEPTFMGPLQVWPMVYILYISINLSSIMKQYGGNASQMFIAN